MKDTSHTLKLITTWFFSLLLLMIGFGGIFEGSISGLFFIVSALSINPLLISNLSKKITINKTVRITVFVLSIMIGFIIVGSEEANNNTTSITSNTKEVKQDLPKKNTRPTTSNKKEFKQDLPKKTIDTVNYEIIEIQDNSIKALDNKPLSSYSSANEIASLPLVSRRLYKIVVSEDIKENQVRPTIEKIILDASTKDNDLDEIQMLLYSNKNMVNGASDIAMATWAPEGKSGNTSSEVAVSNNRSGYLISLTIQENLEEYLKQKGKSEFKLNLTEEERRSIFKEIIEAEDRATSVADSEYPNDIVKNMERTVVLYKEYKKDVRAKYNLTETIETEIFLESFMESWPTR